MMRTWLLALLLIGAFMAIGVASPASGELRVETDPPDPLATTPVTVTVADVFPTACYDVCLVQGCWMSPETYRVLWYIEERRGACIDVMTPLSSELALGTMEPGDYLVRAEEHVGAGCAFGTSSGLVEEPFRVSAGAPVPTVSVWSFMAMTGLVLAAGAVLLHRRMAGASGTGG